MILAVSICQPLVFIFFNNSSLSLVDLLKNVVHLKAAVVVRTVRCYWPHVGTQERSRPGTSSVSPNR
jgi:hypothetical protein